MVKRLIHLLVALFAMSQIVACIQPNGIIDGHATDPCTGQPIAGAVVTLSRSFFTQRTVTDSEGYYLFKDLSVREYNVKISHHDYSFFPATAPIALDTGNEAQICDFSGLHTDSATKNAYGGLTYVSMSGSPSQIGCQHGIMLRQELVDLKNLALENEMIPEDVNTKILPWLPYFQKKEKEEMQALAAATGVANAGNPTGQQAVTYEEIVFFNIQVDIGGLGDSHCSGFAARSGATIDGKLYQGFNWDARKDIAIIRTSSSVLAFYHPDGKNSFVAPIMVGSIGVYTGMNSRYLALDTQNASGQKDINFDGNAFRPATSLIRRSLEDAATIDEMTAILTAPEAYRYPGYITIITSAAENDMVVLEVVGRHFAIRSTMDDVIWSANRLQSDYWLSVPYVNTGENDRMRKYEELLHEPGTYNGFIDVSTATSHILSQEPICVAGGNGTSLVYIPEDGHIYVSTIEFPACQKEYLGFDLNTEGPL